MNTFAFIQNIGPVELIVVLVVALLLFGKRIPNVARNLGKGITEFKRGIKDGGKKTDPEVTKSE